MSPLGTVILSGICSVIFAVTASLLVMWRGQALHEQRLTSLEKADERGNGELQIAAHELHSVVTELTAMAREQSVVNTVVSQTLASVTAKLELHGTSIEFLRGRDQSIFRQAYEKSGS